MKKLLKISMAAVFAVIPMMAFGAAGDVNKDPGATTAGAPVAANSPKYALAPADSATDGNAASAGYVKGAYNAAIKAVNAVHNEAVAAQSAADSAAGTAGQALDLANELDNSVSALTSDVNELQRESSNYANTSLTNVASSAVTSGLIASSAVTSAKIAQSAVTSNAIAADAVTSAAIATSAVTTTEIANSTILLEDINSAAMMISSDPGVVALPDSEKLVTAGVVAEQIYSVRSEMEDLSTKTGVEKTIKSVTFNTPAVTQGITGSVAATTSTILTIMTEWGASTSSAVSAVTSVTNGTLNTNVTVAAPTINAASVSYTEQ